MQLSNLSQHIDQLDQSFGQTASKAVNTLLTARNWLIGDEYYFIDLVFYHRILKCHVLIELKIGEFSHENAGQLNTYLNYYKAEVIQEDDNPPVGLLLVADKNAPLVEYAIAGMDEQLFVKKYLINLPAPKDLETFILKELQ